MTIAAVQAFLEQVTQDPSLQEELAIAMGAENDRTAVTALGQSKGFDFTSDELWQEIQARQAELETRQSGELSEEELEAIAGGETVLLSLATAASISFAASFAAGVKVKNKW
jgi:predicted ribosomally synthesized peptide with nif11-like leader